MQIQCSDGTHYEADHVITTVSLGALKAQHDALFHPKLPTAKIDAIVALGFAGTAKVYLEYEEAFWTPDWTGFGLLWNKEQLDELCIRTGYSWLRGVFRIFTVDHQPSVLCARISGPSTLEAEDASAEQLKDGLTILLKNFIRNWPIPQPKHIVSSKWLSKSHFRGSYSHYSMESEAANVRTLELARPIADTHGRPIVQFAGNATHECFYSTDHGAIETGFREADRIINFYK